MPTSHDITTIRLELQYSNWKFFIFLFLTGFSSSSLAPWHTAWCSVYIAFPVVVWIFLLIRFYVRWRFQTGYLSIIYIRASLHRPYRTISHRRLGSTADVIAISPETRAESLIVCFLIYGISYLLTSQKKNCMQQTFLYLRACVPDRHIPSKAMLHHGSPPWYATPALRLVWYLIIATGVVILIAAELHMLLFCHPVSYGWQRVVSPDLEGSCQSVWTIKVVKLVHTAWFLISDMTVALITPIILLWGLNLCPKVTISVQLLLALGSLSVSLDLVFR